MNKKQLLIGLFLFASLIIACNKEKENNEPKPDPEDKTEKGIDFGDIKMILVAQGSFSMGSTSGFSDEKPVHEVLIDSFYIGKYEVTQALWKEIMDNSPSEFKGDSLPVESVTWSQVQTFLTKLNEKSGLNYCLPTEAEWEYAASGGNQNKNYKYSGSHDADEVAWYRSNAGKTTHIVGSKQVNTLGIYDMSGNVWEWCSDWYGQNYYTSSPQSNPQGPNSGDQKITRGGCWDSDTTNIRKTCRFFALPNSYGKFIGFRLAHDIKK